MTDDEFWAVIDAGGAWGKADPDRHFAAVRKALKKLPAAEVCAFEGHVWKRLTESYIHRLWGAAYLINGGCSDDGFDYFRCWLIGEGRAVYEAAVRDPDTLADKTDPDCDGYGWEDLLAVARRVYEEQTGGEMPDECMGGGTYDPPDEDWDFEDAAEMARRLPKLWAVYGGADGD